MLCVNAPVGTVYPYKDNAKAYLLAEGEAAVRFQKDDRDAFVPILFSWHTDAPAAAFTLRYGTTPELTDGVTVTLPGDTVEYGLYNLFKNTAYYWSLSDGRDTVTGSFVTADLGPRVMAVDGIYNVRDAGGYPTAASRTKQGMVYRGGCMEPAGPFDSLLSEAGKACMRDVLGIKTELDLRGIDPPEGPTAPSPIPGAERIDIRTDGYIPAFDLNDNFRRIFSLLAEESRYPVYMHCVGGADRTGTVVFLLNALLGVSERDLRKDFEFTTFSVYGERNAATQLQPFIDRFLCFAGDSWAEKAASYMRFIGVTEEEIAAIRRILTV